MYKKYFHIAISICLILILGTASFNWLINPFALFKQIELNKLNVAKPAADLNERLSKAYGVTRFKPEGLVLGNSRALAIPITHPGWSHKKTYNLALSSGSMYEALRYFQHANYSKQIKEVVLSVTISMFLPGAGYQPQYNDKRLKVDINDRSTRFRYITYLSDIAASTLSFDATRASIKTIKKNRHFPPTASNIQHSKSCSNPQKDHDRIRRLGGHAKFFVKTNKALMARNWPYPNTTTEREKNFNDSIQYFVKLIRTAYKQGIMLHVIIPPGHALLYETWYIAGLWPVIENWKQMLVNINEHIAYEYKKEPYPIWDFSSYNSITMEPVPVWGDSETPMNWFWETLHFKQETAHLILDRIFGHNRENCVIPNDFGTRINKKNISSHFNRARNQHKKFRQQYPEHIQKLEQFASTLGQQ